MSLTLRNVLTIAGLSLFLLVAMARQAAAADLPDARSTANGKPISVLYLGMEPQLDAAYRKQLTDAGYVVETASYNHPYKLEFFRKFNVIVVDSLPSAEAKWDTFGQKMLYFEANFAHVKQCLEEGAGVIVHAYCAGGAGFGGWNQYMRPLGVQIVRASVRDTSRKFKHWEAYGDNYYCWTEQVRPHAITQGVGRVYYPSANLRWDEFYTAPPLVLDKAWTPLVVGEPEAKAMRAAGHAWSNVDDAPKELVLAAVRDVGKGRLGVIATDPGYIHWFPFLATNNVGEMSYAPADGIAGAILTKGNGEVASDTGKLVDRMMRWCADAPGAKSFGGYDPADKAAMGAPLFESPEAKAYTRVIDWDNPPVPPSWKHRAWAVQAGGATYYPEVSDPFIEGDIQYFKALVGAHTALSDGKGSVADFAAAAKRAGYSLVCFTEAFEELTAAEFRTLVEQCAANSDDDFKCLPGYDIMDSDGNHLLVIAAPEYPHAAWLTDDGTRVREVQMLNLGYYNHKVVAHKPSSSKVLPQERLKHFQGFSVYTYRDGKLIDDSLDAYAWQSTAGSSPQPIVVHEVLSPDAVATAASTGFQQIMPADTVGNAVSYFRTGITTFFEAPARYVISEGPTLTKWVIAGGKDAGPADENRMQFQVRIGAASDAGLRSVKLMDGTTVLRRWLPDGNSFEGEANLRHSHQYGLFVVVEDREGRRAISAPIRTVTERYHYRCSDRQNWLGHIGFHYPGTWLPERLDVRMPVQGTAEGSQVLTGERGTCMAVELNFPFTSNDLQLTESTLDQVYTWALWQDIGFDAMPSWGSEPSHVYEGVMRHWNFTNHVQGQPYVTLIEFDLKTKRDVSIAGDSMLWPMFGGLRERKTAHGSSDGSVELGEVSGPQDIRPGELVGGIIALSDNLATDGHAFGIKRPQTDNGVVAAGTPLKARFLIASSNSSFRPRKVTSFDSDPAGFIKAMGFAGPTPYAITPTRGRINDVKFIADVTPGAGGIAGEVSTPADIHYHVPLQILVNPNWPAGIWHEGKGVRFAGVFDGKAWPQLDVTQKVHFYAGSLITATNDELVLQVVTWTPDRLKVEVHNPTDKPITATVRSPAEITGLARIEREVTVPAGSSLYIE